MIIRSTAFVKSATRPENFPPAESPEIAFCGRSNVGKSSLINTLVNRKALVRTSSTPGRTQLINFFDVNGELSLVDLPGFGYAAVPLAVKEAWGPMVRRYLEERKTLRLVVLLFDVRRTPREEELMLIDWLRHYDVPLLPVITKIDKISRGQRSASIKTISQATGIDPQAFVLFSALSKEGCDEVWGRIEGVLADGEKDVDL